MVLWSRWTSYYSNSFTSIVPVGALLDTGLPVLASDLQAVCKPIVQFARGVVALRIRKCRAKQALPSPALLLPSSSAPHLSRAAATADAAAGPLQRPAWPQALAASLPTSSRRQVEREGAAGLACQALACCSAAAVAASFHRLPDANKPSPCSLPSYCRANAGLRLHPAAHCAATPVQASSVHSGPLPACMPARPAGGLAAVVTASLPLHLCCRCSPPSLQPALQLPSRDAAAPGTPAPPFTACLPPLQVLCRWLTLQTCWGPTTGRPPLA